MKNITRLLVAAVVMVAVSSAHSTEPSPVNHDQYSLQKSIDVIPNCPPSDPGCPPLQ